MHEAEHYDVTKKLQFFTYFECKSFFSSRNFAAFNVNFSLFNILCRNRSNPSQFVENRQHTALFLGLAFVHFVAGIRNLCEQNMQRKMLRSAPKIVKTFLLLNC